MGIIPAGTKLTPRPKELQAWDDVPADAKEVYLRLMENYAEFMAHTDHEVGRLIDSLEASGELDNTLVMYVVGDNGASAEGGLEGTFSELASLLGIQLGLREYAQPDRRNRWTDQRAARACRLGLGDGRSVCLDQANRQSLWRNTQSARDSLAGRH